MEENTKTQAWLRVNALEFSAKRTKTLLENFDDDPEAVFAATEREWSAKLTLTEAQKERAREIRDKDFAKVEQILTRTGAHIVTDLDATYPANLREISDAPPILIARGGFVPEDKFSIAIVGSRRATNYGLSLARRFAHELAARGLTIISGGARGVDTMAHRGALEGGGRTIAFLGCGVDVPYPADNRKLFSEIADGRGAVVSEFPLGTSPEPWRFPARNRLISGASLGVLVIESPADSGSMITARQAGEQGRDVFAIPGPIDGRNSGCHKLIQVGAKLVESVEDILNELGILPSRTLPAADHDAPPSPLPTAPVPNLPPEQRKILDMLTLQPRPADSLISESGLPAPQVIGILTLLEMRGLARRVPGNAFVRVL